MMSWIKAIYHRLAGGWMSDILEGVNCTTTKVCEKADELLARAQVDGEDYWFIQDNRKRPSGKSDRDKDLLTL